MTLDRPLFVHSKVIDSSKYDSLDLCQEPCRPQSPQSLECRL